MKPRSQTHLQSPSSLFKVNEMHSYVNQFQPPGDNLIPIPSSINGGRIGLMLSSSFNPTNTSSSTETQYHHQQQLEWQAGNPSQRFTATAASSGFSQQISTSPTLNWIPSNDGFHSLMRPS